MVFALILDPVADHGLLLLWARHRQIRNQFCDPRVFLLDRPRHQPGDALLYPRHIQIILHPKRLCQHAVFQIFSVTLRAVCKKTYQKEQEYHQSARRDQAVKLRLVIEQKQQRQQGADSRKLQQYPAVLIRIFYAMINTC